MADHDNDAPQIEALRREIDAACSDYAALQAELEAVRAVADRLDGRLNRLNLRLKRQAVLARAPAIVPVP